MLKNNNTQVLTRMAGRSLKSGRRQSVTMILAVLLSAFMLFGVFTVGMTYFKMQRLQNIRLGGGEFDAIMYGVTDEQLRTCRENPDILRFGVHAVSGYIDETEYDNTPEVTLMWADETCWNEIMAPARERVEGHYPVEEDEVMVTEYALEKCGFHGLNVGDTFTAVYGAGAVKCEKTFRISGIWEGFGEKSAFYVSEKFYEQTGLDPADVASGRFLIDFRQKLISQEEQDAFIASMNLGKQQRLFFTVDFAFSVQILTGIAGLALVICLCAYLLIYNIMYLSVAGNIRYYGLLQTIGMTGRQICGLIRRQMFLVGGIGLAGGVLLGSGVSFLVVPSVVKSLGIRMGKGGEIAVSFHPLILLLTLLLTGITVYIAGRKPAKIAVTCSPMEALGYRPSADVRRRGRLGGSRRKAGRQPRSGCKDTVRDISPSARIWRMAKEQITKDKRKAGIVMLSLAAGMSVFLCIATLLTSQAKREYNYNFRDFDMVVKNSTMRKEEQEERVQIFDQTVLDRLDAIEGVAETAPLRYAEITVPWEPEFADMWMREFYETWMNIPYEDEVEEYKEFPENFGSSLVGISKADFEALNAASGEPVDEEEFLEGKTCLLYRDGLEFKSSDVTGKSVTCAAYGDRTHTQTFEIGGLVDVNDYTALLGYPPTIIVSEDVVREFAEEPIIYKIGIRYREEYDAKTEAEILSVLDAGPHGKDYSYESRIEMKKEVEKAQGNMMEIGIGIALILALIGMMNYVNTFVGNIRSRRVEIAVLESIGMTGRQVKKMLILEGLLYAGGAWVITGIAGMAATYWIYQSMNYTGAEFVIPAVPLLCAAVISVLICISVPAIAYREIEKKGIVEYIKMPVC